jgi:hypothetical protein
MATNPDDAQPTSTGVQSGQEPAQSNQQAAGNDTPGHGSTGEGSGSALARLISQQEARIVPGAPEDGPTGSS